MHGLVSILPQPFYGKVEEIWDDLERNFQVRGVRITPFPHFSWNIGDAYDDEGLVHLLQSLSSQIGPFQVTTTGLGIFSGKSPVVFIPVVKTAALCEVHARIWAATQSLGHVQGLSSLYDPEHWTPHITLVFNDATAENFGAILSRLGFQSFNWEMQVENLSFLFQPHGGTAQIKYSVQFNPSGNCSPIPPSPLSWKERGA